MTRLSFLMLFLLSYSSFCADTPLLDQLGIAVKGGSRQCAYTNKQAGTYYGEVNAQNSGGWEGWFVNTQKILNDYALERKGVRIDRAPAATIVFPHGLVRTYPDSMQERFAMLDSINALLIEVSSNHDSDDVLKLTLEPSEELTPVEGSVPVLRSWMRKTSSDNRTVPAWITVGTLRSSTRTLFVIAAGSSLDESRKLAIFVQLKSGDLIRSRKHRMEALLRASYVKTGNHELNIALAWAKLSLDALIMNQAQSGIPMKGIFAGLPWFNNYWGRDSFISLPGATFITGNFSDAREILLSFARFQEQDSTSENYGRIPNIVTPNSIAYNTADGTPWFVKQMYEYVKYSNDTALVRELFPVVRRSIEGTIKYHTDSLGFLTHGEAESWMDAVGPYGPWSRRGNRACDIQAFWFYQLLIGAYLAEYETEYRSAGRWKALADSVEKNFNKFFVDREKNLIYDHLSADGTPSTELRPNQLFCLDLLNSEDVREALVKTVTQNLIYEHGVGTLAQTDSNFHPFHHYEPYYVQDAAYHNGIVWTWLNGQAIYALTRNDKQDLSYALTRNMVHQMLDRGCVGTLSELLDVHVRPGETEPRLSGAFSQAWSLAEFIRSFYQDYLGISVDATAPFIRVNPKLTSEIGNVKFTFRMGESHIAARYEVSGDSVRVIMIADTLAQNCGVNYLWVYRNGDAAYLNTTLTPSETLTIAHSLASFSIFHNQKEILSNGNGITWYLKGFSSRKAFESVNLAMPSVFLDLPALQKPTYPLLSLEDVRRTESSSRILFDKEDATGDDKGENGRYEYPSNAYFKPGILDITHVTVHYDNEYAYFRLVFRALTNPGWHPEYGFQLTYAAIAIHRSDSGMTSIGLNSRFSVAARSRFDRLISVGGGLSVSDERGRLLCEYLPQAGDEKNPIGNTQRKTIEFSIPLKYLGVPSHKWTMIVLIGAQDDHGGAGIGEFRSVEQIRSEWAGGGRRHEIDSNVYDTIDLP